MKEVLNKVRGNIELFTVKDGHWELIHKQHNLVTYSGADLLAKAVAGALNINTMYLVFENNPAAVRISEDLSNNADTYADESANRGFVRVSTMGEPIYSASGDSYTNNEVAFLGVTDGTSEQTAVVEDGTSVFYHTALVAAPDEEDQTSDIIFSCSDLAVEITKVAGAQIGIRWTLTFEAPTV